MPRSYKGKRISKRSRRGGGISDWFSGTSSSTSNGNSGAPSSSMFSGWNPFSKKEGQQVPYGPQQQSPYGQQQSPYGQQQSPYGQQQPPAQNFSSYGGRRRRRRRSMRGGNHAVVPNQSLTNLAATGAPITDIKTAHASMVGGTGCTMGPNLNVDSSHQLETSMFGGMGHTMGPNLDVESAYSLDSNTNPPHPPNPQHHSPNKMMGGRRTKRRTMKTKRSRRSQRKR